MQDDSINKINLTSLVDVSLTLVIIFMVVAPFIAQTGITITSSRMGESKGKVAQDENVTINLNAVGEIKVNGKSVLWDELPQALKNAIPKSKDKMVMLLASPTNQVKQIVNILDIARQEGAKRVALLRKK
ncbi:MAG: biopolymer transporter ExbD [Endomicrobiales bacterium]|nr:biopolymer transporter ExbD [Endomicrobiales bacterium]